MITAVYEDGSTVDIDMISSDVDVSQYNANKIGEQEIKVIYKNFAQIFKIIVYSPITGISLNETNVILDDLYFTENDEEIKLIATLEPSTCNPNTKIKWESSNEKIAKVDQNGKVQMVNGGYGICQIVAKTDDGIESSCTVTVRVNKIITYDQFSTPISVPARDANGKINNGQSLTVITDSKKTRSFYTVGLINKDETLSNVQVYSPDGTYLESARRWSNVLGHANGMTYNPITRKLYILPRPHGGTAPNDDNNAGGRLYKFNVDFTKVIDMEKCLFKCL